MLPRSTKWKEGMGFLDKLLGRNKESTPEGVGESAKNTDDQAMDASSDPGDTTKDALDGDEGVSDVTESEQRLDEVRDQTMRDEGRMP